MKDLKSFVQYIRQERLSEVVNKEIQLFTEGDPISLNPSLASKLKSPEFLTERLEAFLTSIENDAHAQYIHDRLALLHNHEIPDINPFDFKLSEVIEVLLLQKIAIHSFTSDFTNDATLLTSITIALEQVYRDVQRIIFQSFESIQKKAQLKLAESEERYKDLFDNALDLIHFVNPDGTIIYVNNAWMKSLGFTVEEIKGRSLYDLIAEDEKNAFIKYRTDILNNHGDQKQITVSFISKSGDKVIVEGFVSPKFIEGKALYTRGIFREVTARVKQEEKVKFYLTQLAEREENLQQLINHAPDAIIVIDVEGNIIFWNPKAEEIFGWTQEEIIGKKLHETIIPEGYRQAHIAGMKRYLTSGQAHILNQTIEITALNKKGEEFYISLTISRSQQAGKTIFISFIRDITQQKKDEMELTRKRKELEESHRELEQYAWLTSHDLREPLRKILTFSDIILTRYTDLPEDVRTYINKISDSGKRMGNLIQAILFYSSITDDQKLFESVDLNYIIHEVLADLEIAIKESGAVFQIGELPTIEAVPFQMKQLFQNLISNSIKYRKENIAPVIEISTSPKSVDTIKLCIKDNGKGFLMKDEQKIFQLFQRLNIDHSIQGTGVGLAICKKIVQNHSGEIMVNSTPDEGAEFCILLPIKQRLA